jgi:hypothetical protein
MQKKKDVINNGCSMAEAQSGLDLKAGAAEVFIPGLDEKKARTTRSLLVFRDNLLGRRLPVCGRDGAGQYLVCRPKQAF